jgi:transcriptional repressor NrdR
LSCRERFTTYEIAELTLPKIIKRDGARENFDEIKLRAGMQRSLEKRPVKSEDVEAAVSRIKKVMTARGDREIKADDLGELVMKELSSLDHVAYVRFASVYRSFQDLDEFTEMIERLKKK